MAKRRRLSPGTIQPDLFANAIGTIEKPEQSALDDRFADLIVRLNGSSDDVLHLVAQTVSAWRGNGHACMPLSAIPADPKQLEQSLRSSRVVGAPGEWKPLILDTHGRLYLHRYWEYEQNVAAALLERTASVVSDLNEELIDSCLDELIDDPHSDQRVAVATALRRNLCIVTGGPGTGKTRTIAFIVAALLRLIDDTRKRRIALAAPTGKAAARITESLRAAGCPPIPDATTIHRLIGAAGSISDCRFNRKNPIPADIVIVDEASMIDLALMWRVLDAVRPDARLILLGDKDQLASVEAGNVFGDICAGSVESSDSSLGRHVVALKKSFRFNPDSGIQLLADAIRTRDPANAVTVFRSDRFTDIRFYPTGSGRDIASIHSSELLESYGAVLKSGDAGSALDEFARFRILCALRNGPAGVESLNDQTESVLLNAGLIPPARGNYHGRPILIMENDYNLRLFNGDIGILWQEQEASHAIDAYFKAPDGTVRRIHSSRLPRHETAWAMTVHKSQGSEFERVLFVLPDHDSPVLTRELIYTAATRAKTSLAICGSPEMLERGIVKETIRASGLRDALRK